MNSFIELGVRPEIVKGLAELGFASPTPVQEKVIPLLLGRGRDWISLAQTGTGKTAAFGIPLIQNIDPGSPIAQALVLCPTRELCVQVARDIEAFGRYLPGVKTLAVYGGARMDVQINTLRRGAHIIVATPGRLLDLIRRGAADVSQIGSVVLDEADEMLNMGFQEEISAILGATPATRDTLLFSATMSPEVARIAGTYMTDPGEILIGQRNSGAENVQHLYYMVRAQDRFPALKRIVDLHPDIYGIIFCRTRQETQDVAGQLIQEGYLADALHGELSQAQRDLVMGKFRRKNLQLLVATDVAARGVDVNDLTHVINYNLPDDPAAYTHRSGRTGRAGKTGTSVSIIHQREGRRIKTIEKNIGKPFVRERIPSGGEVCASQVMHRINMLLEAPPDLQGLEPLLPQAVEKLAALDRQELVRRLVALESKRFLEYYRDAPDLNVQEKGGTGGMERKKENGRRRERGTEHFTRFHVNVGKNDGVLPQRLIAIINSGSPKQKIAIGRIELMRNFSFIEADSRFSRMVLKAFHQQMINGKKVSIEIAADRKNQAAGSGDGRFMAGKKRVNGPGANKRYKRAH
ncbi:MAG: DEAD/DEAH box helicase [Desulfobulbaceae bacterium]|nr:DEAD/DEAH box helicase [Desulfobulbaceae bacterium]MDY0350142.1 DEAD/DEAH box helicase [Desulfobulbaceae bacterium]